MRLPAADVLKSMPEPELRAFLLKREELILKEKRDPYRYGFIPTIWKLALEYLEKFKSLLLLGGNRSSKSTFAARRVVETLLEKPGARVWCFQTTADNSREMQQSLVWRYIPPEIKEMKKGKVLNINYSQKGGFTENTFVLPNGSQCFFRNYAQDIQTIEGGEVDLAWCDELVPLDWLETIKYRLTTRNGELLVTFTPIEGYSPTVKEYLSGATTLIEEEADLLPVYKENDLGQKVISHLEKVPVLQKCAKGTAHIVYFHTKANPFNNFERLKSDLEGESRENILTRAYGVPTKAIGNRFPKFNDKVHVISPDRIPKDGTNYLFVDPCSGRNWFKIWVRIDSAGRAFVYREWPSPEDYIEGVGFPGPWATPSGRLFDGSRGPAQKSFGWGLKDYQAEILRRETNEDGVTEKIFERWMDSRYGHTPTVAKEAPTTLIEECADIGLDFLATPTDRRDGEKIDLINDWLAYDQSKPIDFLNQPRLMISSSCRNLIYAMKEWTGQDGKDGATKDPIDCVGFLVTSGITNVEGERLQTSGGGSY